MWFGQSTFFAVKSFAFVCDHKVPQVDPAAWVDNTAMLFAVDDSILVEIP